MVRKKKPSNNNSDFEKKKIPLIVLGRPTKYKKQYNQQLYEHMRQGLSFESFGGIIGVAWETLYKWEKKHPDFLQAKIVGRTASLLFWEELGRQGAAGKIRGFSYGTWYRNMTNRFAKLWREKQEILITDETMKNPSEMTDDELSEKIVHALKVIEKYESNIDL